MAVVVHQRWCDLPRYAPGRLLMPVSACTVGHDLGLSCEESRAVGAVTLHMHMRVAL
jgi:hypothetical protein